MPIDKPPTETVGPTAEKKSPTKSTKKAKIQVAEIERVDEDDELAYPVTPGKILSLSSQERPALLVALTLRIISEGAGMVMPLLLAEAYDAVIDGYGSIEEAGATRDTVTRVFTLALSLHVAGNVFGFLAGCATGVAGERVVSRLRRRLYDHLLTQEMSFFDTHKSGDLVSRLGADTLLVQQATTQALNECLIGLIKVLAGVVLMFIVSWELTFIVFCSLLCWLCLVMNPLMRVIQTLTNRYQNALANAATASTEALGAMRTVRSFAAEALEHEKYHQSVGTPANGGWWPARGETTYRAGVLKAIVGSALGGSGFLVIFGALNVSLWVGFVMITENNLRFGKLSAFQAYQIQIVIGIGQLAASAVQLAQAKGGAAKIFKLLDKAPEIPVSGGEVPTETMRGAVTFKDVSFSYPTSNEKPVLRGLSFSVPADSTAALVGPSGCGKSTVLSLLMRFYEARGGVVAIDGNDVTTLDPAWLRSKLAFVQQEPVLFGVTVRENVAYALAAADARRSRASHLATAVTLTKAEQEASLQARVEDACHKAHAHTFISELSEGYDTLVGERGVKLSGGQKQRLAIARALLAQPRILLLDEATSALDAESERLVQKAIDQASAGRSVIVVAHRLSTVKDADQIAVMNKGAIEDCGTHAELIERCKTYQTLVQRQMSGAPAAAAE